ncbi:hypothetical protein AMATHDRAFT_149781 [Amanita thiersii Skay4041]|uniref:tRNA-5-taurinomethyluridine 2-sulfurtransferase n=1 Tax=Amanita thiersii Skay4041 TaxID=703135 RepID=A0A2A9NLA3_9AGAR|nr:hypothetical protein AMATHDRAFT_149781 [Amanita thiersii Skay4041]
MSGGVDSSLTARLLSQKDYDLSAVYMRNWDTRDESGTDKGCEWEKDWEDVQRVCRMLDIPCQMVDLSREYWNRVFEPSLDTWQAGSTPNPDVWCNREIKFGALLDHLPKNSSSRRKTWLATGHYARKEWSMEGPNSDIPRPRLLRALDIHKDQSYFLSSITEEGLAQALFPLGRYTKMQVRELARNYRLPTAARKESMGICFVGQKAKFNKFLSSYLPSRPGPIYDAFSKEQIGEHTGLWNYTIGENARLAGKSARMYVAKKDPSTNSIHVVRGGDNPALYSNAFRVTDFRWIWPESPPAILHHSSGSPFQILYRYRMKHTVGFVEMESTSKFTITFTEPQKAVTPGQVAALYQNDVCLGCGTISATLPDISTL